MTAGHRQGTGRRMSAGQSRGMTSMKSTSVTIVGTMRSVKPVGIQGRDALGA